jgi:hypothetical protein
LRACAGKHYKLEWKTRLEATREKYKTVKVRSETEIPKKRQVRHVVMLHVRWLVA